MIDDNIVIDIILPYIIPFNSLSNNFEMARKLKIVAIMSMFTTCTNTQI